MMPARLLQKRMIAATGLLAGRIEVAYRILMMLASEAKPVRRPLHVSPRW
jgi:hypothetical protein